MDGQHRGTGVADIDAALIFQTRLPACGFEGLRPGARRVETSRSVSVWEKAQRLRKRPPIRATAKASLLACGVRRSAAFLLRIAPMTCDQWLAAYRCRGSRGFPVPFSFPFRAKLSRIGRHIASTRKVNRLGAGVRAWSPSASRRHSRRARRSRRPSVAAGASARLAVPRRRRSGHRRQSATGRNSAPPW